MSVGKRPVQMRIASPGGIDAEAETHEPCPVCKAGLVPATVATAVRSLLAAGADGPPPQPPSMPRLDTVPLPHLITAIMPAVEEAPRSEDVDLDELDD